MQCSNCGAPYLAGSCLACGCRRLKDAETEREKGYNMKLAVLVVLVLCALGLIASVGQAEHGSGAGGITPHSNSGN